MPHVLEDPDILEEHSTLSPDCDDCHALPSSQRERSPFLALLYRLITPAPRLRTRRQAHGAPGASRFATSLDILAREHPDLHLRVVVGMG